jgi:magnesium transporter
MAELERITDSEDLQHMLQRVVHLLDKQKVVEELVHRQEMPRHDLVESLVHKQHIAELQRLLDQLHPADVAYLLEALPLPDRLQVWNLVKAERDGEILLEVSDAVRESLIADMEPKELVAAAENLDTDEIADLAPDLPREVIQDVFRRLTADEREQLRAALSYEEGTVGAVMDFDMVTIREDVTLEVVLRYLRRMDELPDHFDKLFVVDRSDRLQGELPLNRLLLHDPEAMVAAVMDDDPVRFQPLDDAHEAAQAFERYDLVSAAVVDPQNRLIGRLSVDAMVDFIRQETSAEVLSLGGLRAEEDVFAPVWKSLKNRWTWLGINLVTAFIASRVIGMFEGSIEKLAALAALMPIIAGIGGNSGNQTITMIVRALALGQISMANAKQLFAKEIGISLLNGVVWGSVVGLFAFFIYHNIALGVVMTLAMILNLLLAATVGVLIPLAMHKLGRDPAQGSSVMITAVTDSGGFFIFLGLATLVLRHLSPG